jgi:hypothetical protein
LLNIFQTLRRPSLRVWNKSYSVAELNDLRKMAPVVENVVQATAQQIPAMRIRNLSLMVNTGGYYNGEN